MTLIRKKKHWLEEWQSKATQSMITWSAHTATKVLQDHFSMTPMSCHFGLPLPFLLTFCKPFIKYYVVIQRVFCSAMSSFTRWILLLHILDPKKCYKDTRSNDQWPQHMVKAEFLLLALNLSKWYHIYRRYNTEYSFCIKKQKCNISWLLKIFFYCSSFTSS